MTPIRSGFQSPFTRGRRQDFLTLEDVNLQKELRRVDSSRFLGGQVDWSPESVSPGGVAGEQKIVHSLGKVPSGMFQVSGDVPLRWWATAAQRDRWTESEVYFMVDTLYHHESGVATMQSAATSSDVTMARQIELGSGFVSLVVAQTAAIVVQPLKLHSWNKNGEGGGQDVAPLVAFRVNQSNHAAAEATFSYQWQAWGTIETAHEFKMQVY